MTDSEIRQMQASIARNALAVMLIGLLAGFAWAFALLGEVRISPIPIVFADQFPGEPDRWRAVHLGCLLNSIMALAIAGVLRLFSLSHRQALWVKIGVILAVWGNLVFYFANVFAPNHSLSIGDNALGAGNLAGAIGYVVAMFAAIGLIIAVVILLRAAISTGPSAE